MRACSLLFAGSLTVWGGGCLLTTDLGGLSGGGGETAPHDGGKQDSSSNGGNDAPVGDEAAAADAPSSASLPTPGTCSKTGGGGAGSDGDCSMDTQFMCDKGDYKVSCSCPTNVCVCTMGGMIYDTFILAGTCQCNVFGAPAAAATRCGLAP